MSEPVVRIERELREVLDFVSELENTPSWLLPVRRATVAPAQAARYDMYLQRPERIGSIWWEGVPSPPDATLRSDVISSASHLFDSKVTMSFKQGTDSQSHVDVGSKPEIPETLGRLARRRRRKSSHQLWEERLNQLRRTFELGRDGFPERTRFRSRQSLDEARE
jgi:hypothetical protein